MDTGIIFDIERFSIRDGPGIRTTVFFKGCPLSCWWCHNPESQSPRPEMMFREYRCIRCWACIEACPEDAILQVDSSTSVDTARCTLCGDCVRACFAEAREIVGREMTIAQVMQEIEKDVIFYDESGGGVTFSGGEPLQQADFLFLLLQGCKDKEIHTAVDTSGLAPWKTLARIAEYVDVFLYDLKVMDDEKHRRFTGVSNHLILSNLEALSEEGRTINVRVPIIPGINDDDENLKRLGSFAASLARPPRVSILPYHKAGITKYTRLNKTYSLPDTASPSDERMAGIAAVLQAFGLCVKTGG